MKQTTTANYFRTLASHTVVFGLSSLVRPLSQLVLIRLHTNTSLVSVEGYAAWTLFQVALNVGILLLSLGLGTAFFRFYLLAEDDRSRKEVVSRSFRLTLSISVIGGGLLYLSAGLWSKGLIGSTELAVPARQIALAVAGNTLSIVPLALLRAEGRWKPFALFSFLKFFLLIMLNWWLLVYLGKGLEGITLSLAITNILLAVVYLPFLRGRILRESWIFDFNRLLRYGVPLIAVDITLWVLNSQGQILLNVLRTPLDVALFGFALRISFIATVGVVMPFSIAFGPLLFKAKRDQEDPRPLYARTMIYIWTLAVGTSLAVTMLTPELCRLLGKTPLYHEAVPIVVWLVFSSPFFGIFYVFSSGASLKDKTWVFPILLLVSALIQLGLNFWWIPELGVTGAAAAMLCGYMILAALTLFVNQLTYPISFPWKRFVVPAGIALILLALKIVLLPDLGFGYRLLLALAYPIILLASGWLDDGERTALLRFLKRNS